MFWILPVEEIAIANPVLIIYTFFGFGCLAGSSSDKNSSGIAEGSSGAAGPDGRKMGKSGDPI